MDFLDADSAQIAGQLLLVKQWLAMERVSANERRNVDVPRSTATLCRHVQLTRGCSLRSANAMTLGSHNEAFRLVISFLNRYRTRDVDQGLVLLIMTD